MKLSTAQARVLSLLSDGPIDYSATGIVKRTRYGLQTKGGSNFKATRNGVKVAGFSVAAASALVRAGLVVSTKTREGWETFDSKVVGSTYSTRISFRLA